MVVVDHHGAKIYRLDPSDGDVAQQAIRPYDPHSLLHDLAHKVQSAEKDRHLPEDTAFYGRIADAVAAGGRIVVVSHGTARSHAAQHLTEYLRAHHRETYQREVKELTTDVSGLSLAQLLVLAGQAWAPAT
jgi:hypothetical protein